MVNPFSATYFQGEDIYAVVDQFQIERSKLPMGIIKAERLSPDSNAVVFLWDKFYVLYSEDFIDTLETAQSVIEEWFSSKVVRFISPKAELGLDEVADDLQQPEDIIESIKSWLPYAARDGQNFALLAEVRPSEDNRSYWALRMVS